MTVYKQALSGKVVYPSHVTRFARHLISQFLQVAPSKRIGSLRGGVVDIKSHPFFKDFDWEALETRRMVRETHIFGTLTSSLFFLRNALCSSRQ
jgi:protein kinase A